MLHVLGYRRAPIGRSSPASARPSHPMGRRVCRASAVWALTCLLLVAPASFVASASSCAAGKHCSATTGHATKSGGTGKKGVANHESSTKHAGPVGSGTSSTSHHAAPAPTHHVTVRDAGPGNGHHGSHPDSSTGSHHRRPGARHGHPRGHASAGARKDGPGGRSEPNFPHAAIGRINLPADGTGAEPVDSVSEGLSVRSARLRMQDRLNAARPIEQVAQALGFPAALLGVILLFMAFQQRADRRDPKLAQAPVGSRQETLEFR